MNKLRKSPKRGSFHIETQVKLVAEGKKTPEEAEDMIKFYRGWQEKTDIEEQTEEYKVNNMEYDLRTSDYIAEKCKDEFYAQNLYAAMCNREFVKNDVWPRLKDERWSCSWRHAGGIIADIQQEGDYIDWYCSGIRGPLSEEDKLDMTQEQIDDYNYRSTKIVGEGHVTDEIRNDLLKLGWIVIDDEPEVY